MRPLGSGQIWRQSTIYGGAILGRGASAPTYEVYSLGWWGIYAVRFGLVIRDLIRKKAPKKVQLDVMNPQNIRIILRFSLVYLTNHWGTRSNQPVKIVTIQLNLWRSLPVSMVLWQSLLIWLLAIITKCAYCHALFIFRSTWIEYFYPEVSNIFQYIESFSTFSIYLVFSMILSQCNPGFDLQWPSVHTVTCYSYSDS